MTLTNALTNTTFTGYNWANRSTTDQNYFIRNTEGYQYIDTNGSVIGTADPRRNYKALMILFDSSLQTTLRVPVVVRAGKSRRATSTTQGSAPGLGV